MEPEKIRWAICEAMNQFHLWPEQPVIQDDRLTASFVLEDVQGKRRRLWYQIPAEHKPALTDQCDPFVIAALFTAMQHKTDLYVHGVVSPSLLRNLAEFQATWHTWLPQMYQSVEIRAEVEREAIPTGGEAAIMAFSGGLDSAFTAWRHRTGQAGRQRENIQAGLIIHGFDIPVKSQAAFEHALERARRMLDSLGMETIPLVTNLRSLGGEFANTHGAILASCLTLLQKRFSTGLIAASEPNQHIVYRWAAFYGSCALSDPFLASQAFTIVHDGANYTRFDKTLALADWPEALRYLRVCTGQNPERRAHNCCRCEKCIGNILAFRVLGMGLPPCFEKDVSNQQIIRMHFAQPDNIYYFDSIRAQSYYYREIIKLARQRHCRAAWVDALRLAICLNQLAAPIHKYKYRHDRSSRLK